MTLEGSCAWRLTVRRETDHVTILRASTREAVAVLPETLQGLPVTALGDHALAPGSATPDGESVEILCGPAGEDAAWDNRKLRDLTLPASVDTLGDYALFNCRSLETLRLSGQLKTCGSGTFINCHALGRLLLSGTAGENLAWLTGELTRELDITFPAEGETARLIFPSYREDYEENSPAHHFDYAIHGGGYPYRHCFRNRQILFADYDALWPRYLEAAQDTATAVRLALCRLRWPVALSEASGRQYRAFLAEHGAETLTWLIGQRDTEGLAFVLRTLSLPESALSAGCETARRSGAAEAMALLLEARRPCRPRAAARTFDL